MSPALIHKQQASPGVLNTLFVLNIVLCFDTLRAAVAVFGGDT